MKRISLPGIDLSDDERFFLSHTEDMLHICERDRRPVYSAFLDERQAMLAEMFLDSICCRERIFFGGYEDAVRKQLCIYGEHGVPDAADFPLTAVSYRYRVKDTLRHSDFLGALMSLGLKRNTVGDIIPSEGEALVFVCNAVLDDALSLQKIGRTGVSASVAEVLPEISSRGGDEFRAWLSSLRLDCALAAAAGMSRDKASAFIKSEGAVLNCRKVFSPSCAVSEGDVFSARGKGKFSISAVGGRSKKDRILVSFVKYR